MNKLFISLSLFLFLMSCNESPEKENKTPEQEETVAFIVNKSEYGTTKNGEQVDQYTFATEDGFQVSVITYGGIITSIEVPDKNGNYEDVVLGYNSLQQYEKDNPYFGALIGRYGNRIADGSFSLNGNNYSLEKNDGPNHLHGGSEGFHTVVWEADIQEENEHSVTLELKHTSEDGAGGYPGNLETTVRYTINDDQSIDIDYKATTDKPTVVNLTQHSYFNLSGNTQETILGHELRIAADEYLPVNETLIPTGERRSVEGTPFDFTEAKPIGRDISKKNNQLTLGKGYDHCWILNNTVNTKQFAASLYYPENGRLMEVTTTEPALQFYSGNFLDGSYPAKGGGNYEHRTGLCLETQHFPNSPNEENFPSVVLQPGETYHTQTTYKFTTK